MSKDDRRAVLRCVCEGNVGWCPATLLPERETELRDINELCDSMGCVVCTASVYDLGYPPAENPGEEGDVLEIPF